uniref:Solute carrier family 39 member 11 n=1 Tax=Rousettus aegyptiacus TaxID=9407 RepID=A0A7J8GFM9_ROUAE|nr:solute carrier family 39 member 11 [Rousettus aegyptiacus]
MNSKHQTRVLCIVGQKEFSHWDWDPELPRGPRRQPPLARGWLLHLESLLVRAAERHGGASGRALRGLRRGAGRAHPALRSGLCRWRHGLRGGGRHHPRGSDQWQREAGLLGLHPGICGDDVAGCWPGLAAECFGPQGGGARARLWLASAGPRASSLTAKRFYFPFSSRYPD